MTIKHIVLFSGGTGSWKAAQRVRDEFGTEDMVLLFTDVLIEDKDLYRFIEEAAVNIGVPLTKIADGRTPWEVFFDVKMMGNTRVDPCSKALKRDLADKWIRERFKPEECIMYVGIDWSEINRYERMAPRKLPYVYKAPLTEPPYLSKTDMMRDLVIEGIEPPRLYEMGFPHNNCGGFCVKAGQAQFKLLHEKFPERYEQHAQKEQEFREFIGKDVSILRDRRGGPVKPFPLTDFRKEVESKTKIDEQDFGGCGCFTD